MKHNGQRFSAGAKRALLGLLLVSILATGNAQAQAGLKTIQPQGGGMIVYGQVEGATTEAGAMGYVLRNLHQNLGTKPQVGKLFEVKGTGSYAVFLSVTRKDQGQGKAPMQVAGLLIASKVGDGHIEAALLSDEASRFPKTVNPMAKTLFSVWHPFPKSASPAPASRTGSGSAAAAPLHRAVTQDRSAALSIPDGWQIQGGGGTILAANSQGETAWMGIAFNAADTNNPNVQRTMQQVRSGMLRAPAYVNANYIPYGADAGKTFVALMQASHKKSGHPQANYNLTNISPAPSGPDGRCAHIEGSVDFNDGKGQRELDAVYCIHPPGPMGNWASEAYMTTVPVQNADKERATLAAVLASYQVDMRVVGAEAHQIAGPEIARIQAIGRATTQRIEEAHAQQDVQRQSIEKYWDNNDKQSQAFSNLQLGYSVVGTADDKYHGTFWNQDAAALVESNPDKFQYVATPNFWKGIDY